VNDPIPSLPARGPRVVYRAPREWTRMHPISPLLGGWAVMGVALAVLAYNVAPSWTGVDPDLQEIAHILTRSLVGFALALVAILAIALMLGYVQWRFNEFRLGDEAVHQRKGVLFKQQRQARLDRLQAVDLVQPLLARIFGFAAIKIEVAGGENSGIQLAYLRLGDAEAIRNELLALSAGVKRAKAAGTEASVDAVAERLAAPVAGADATAGTGVTAADAVARDGGDAAYAGAGEGKDSAYAGRGSLRDVVAMPSGVAEHEAVPERPVYEVPVARLILSIVLTWPTLWIMMIPIVVGAAVWVWGLSIDQIVSFTFGAGAGFAAVVPAILALAGYYWTRVNGGFGFKAAIAEDGIRLRHGLTETRRQTVPAGRVQAVRFEQSLLWRRADWWRVTINVAGYQDDQVAVSTLLPVGTRQDALTALWMVLPDLGDPDPEGTVSYALSGSGAEGGFTPSPSRARLFDPFQWRQRGVRATERALMIRRGRLVREMFVVPHERTQSLAIQQGPLQRRRRLASFTVHSTRGPVRPVAENLDVDDAVALLDSQTARARESRATQTPEQWMTAVGIRG